jgi:nicotinate-nucleotide adenylyltransferase
MSHGARSPEAIGVLGGTFDPVHLGHLRIAEETRRLLGLSRTLLLPTALPPHKHKGELSPVEHRVAMVRLAASETEGIEVCPLELEPERVCYTLDTLRALSRGLRPLRPVFILGMDSLLQFTIWRGWQDLVREFDLAVVGRSESEGSKADDALDPALVDRLVSVQAGPASGDGIEELQPGRGGRIFRLSVEPIPISSSAIRAHARAGRDLGNLVPPGVAEYIQRTGLYRRKEAP